MNDTCGLRSYEPFASWDRDSSCWKTSEATSLWALTLSSLTLPAWGGMRAGELYELPTPEPPTSGPACSSLPTPRTSDTNGAGRHGDGGLDLRTAVTLLPTPTTQDKVGVRGDFNWDSPNQTLREVVTLLPTPKSARGGAESVKQRPSGAKGSTNLEGALLPTPRAQDEYERRNRKTMIRIRDEGGDMTLPTWAAVVAPLIGATTALPSPDGSTSSDDPHQHQLSLDELATPA